MDKSKLMFRGGVRSATKQIKDGPELEIFYKARTPSEIAAYLDGLRKLGDDSVASDKHHAAFIAASLCNEDGSTLMTPAEAAQVPLTLKPELCLLVIQGSNEAGDAGKG